METPINIWSITVQRAIYRGLRTVSLPSKVILILGTAACVLLLIVNFSWWHFLYIPFGVLLSSLYSMYAAARWRLWAYEYVGDIHQLQRSAELAGLLFRKSHERIGLVSRQQKEKLKTLLLRFSEEPVFIDDYSIPDHVSIYSNAFFQNSVGPILILNERGIQFQSNQFFEWNEIENERIATVTYSRVSPRTGTKASAGSKDFFKFEYQLETFEISISSIDIAAWELDLLLYIYRGRYSLKEISNYSNQP